MRIEEAITGLFIKTDTYLELLALMGALHQAEWGFDVCGHHQVFVDNMQAAAALVIRAEIKQAFLDAKGGLHE